MSLRSNVDNTYPGRVGNGIVLKALAILCLMNLLSCKGAFTQTADGSVNYSADMATTVWKFIPKESIKNKSQLLTQLNHYKALSLNKDALLRSLPKGSPNANGKTSVVVLPLPDSTFIDFEVAESTVMDPVLAAKFPEIKTFSGKGINEPASHVRMEMTPRGFFAMVTLNGQTSYIQPNSSPDTLHYITYYKSAVKPGHRIPFEEAGPLKD